MGIKKNIFAPSTTGRGATRRAAMLLLVMMLTTATAWAQTTITPTPPSQDDDGYYLIGTAAELYGFAELVNNGNATANAKLTADIVVNENVLDANGEAYTGEFVQWTPIGNDYFEGKVYSGTFDGQGHTVSGLYVSGSSWRVGLIGAVSGSAVVKNLGIVDSYFSSSNNLLGSIVGGVANNSSVTLANVYSTSTVKGDNWIGGLAGGGDGSVSVVNSYFAGKTSANFLSGQYGSHHDDLVAGDFDRSTLTVCNAFVLGTSQYGTSVTAGQLSDGTVAAALHYYQDALADGSMFGLSGGKTNFSGTIDGVSVTTADVTLHTFDGDATAYSSKYIVGNTTPLPVNVEREGYTFFGWYDNADLEGDAVTSISSSETGNKEYWAKFERSHAVSFALGGGTIRSGEIDHYIEGETTVLPTYVTKVGASFEGWYTTEDFTGSRYYSIPSTATEDMTFYAKWGEEKTTFYLRQGGSPEPVSILYEGESIVWLDETTTERYVISDNSYNYWSPIPDINVPYTGGASTFDHNISEISVAQSGFYVFTLTDMGGESWFVSILKSMLNCDVASIPTQVYTGSAIEPDVTVKDGETTLTLGTDYEVAYSNNVNAGTATVTITGKGNYSGETAATFTIIPKAVTNDGITIAAIADRTYTGSAIEPEVTVTDGGTTLTLGTDYTIGYSANVNVGTATATITGKGNYSGSREVLFTIAKATPTVTTPTAVENLIYNGSAQALVNAGNTDFGTLLYSLDGQNYSDDIPTGTDAGTYTVYYKVEGSDNWNAVAAQTIEVTITYFDASLAAIVDNSDVISNIITNYDSKADVTLSDRTLYKDGNWNTLCLPFSLSAAQIAANADFAGATLMTMDVTEKNGFDAEDGTLYLYFKSATEIEAGVPYLVKWEKAADYEGNEASYDISNPVFEGVTISNSTAQTMDSETTGLETVQMVGTYSPVSVTADDKSILFLGDANTLYYSTVDRQIRSCRAYFSVPYINGHAEAKARAFALSFDGEETTGIFEVSANSNEVKDDVWYLLDGVRLSGKPTQRGMYINKGKKILVK
ncbi:InlB B-repeat-containing protein [Prevotella sp. E15-22]|uniref:InlB B-repeat-containing protein n=1 Tax=Prevotella sp. E15-22 TaxID=2937774 RepID=UPI0020680DEB|nr:InlB B-repeat-containing protein [Prevotella sp. E15-22]UPS43678.1 InlB B-repeat-containing protein [Prevotella sp. E15-22]